MNLPGEGKGNWNWRMSDGAFTDPAGNRLARLTWLYRRRPDQAHARRGDPGSPPHTDADDDSHDRGSGA